MKTERLLEIAKDLQADLQTTNIINLLDQLIAALQNQINSPNAQHQETISTTLKTIQTNLDESRVNTYPVSWMREIERLDISKFFGGNLAEWLKSSFERNQIIITETLKQVQFIRTRLNAIQTSISQLISSLAELHIQTEELQSGEYEITIEIPREAVNNEIRELGKEFERLDRVLSVFSEIATGTREPFHIRAIASSQLMALLDSVPATAAMVALALERMVTVYEKVLHILTMYKSLAQTDLPKEVLDKIQDHVAVSVKSGIEDYAKELELTRFEKVPQARRAELGTELRMALSEIARRLDEGYGFDVRGGPVPPEDKAKPDDAAKVEVRKFQTIVNNARQRIRLFKPQGEPILRLPAAPDADTSSGKPEPK